MQDGAALVAPSLFCCICTPMNENDNDGDAKSDSRAKLPIRTYGRRRGRKLRAARQALIDERLPALQIRLPAGDGPVEPSTWFAQPFQDYWFEIGFGAGEHLAFQAQQHPTVGHIGSEIFINGIGSLIRHIDERRLANVRLFTDDARELLKRLPEASLGRVFLLFPDPWPKLRHAARRFVTQANLALLARALRDGAPLRIATDHPVYLQWTLAQMRRQPWFEWTARRADDFRTQPADAPITRYQRKAVREGRTSTYLDYVRRPRGAAGPESSI